MAAAQWKASAAETTAATSRCNLEAVAGVIVVSLGAQPKSEHASVKVRTAASSLRINAAPRFAGRADLDAAGRVRLTWLAPAGSASRCAEGATLRRPRS